MLYEVDDEEESENFYETLQDQLARINKKEHVIVLGDFNARVGPLENPSRLHGRHNPDKRNVNGSRLVDFCNTNGLIITNTIFPHKRIHQWTWYHPNQKKGHVLDYVLISHQLRANICDTKVTRKTIHISDHNMVISKLILKNHKIKYNKNPNNNTNILHDKITNPTKLEKIYINKFKEELTYNLNKIDQNNSVEEMWKCFKESLLNASKQLPKKNKMPKRPWVNEEVKKLSTEKSELHFKIKALKQNGRAIPQNLISSYKEIKTESRKACRKAIDTWWEEKTEEAEKTTELTNKQGRGGSILKLLKKEKHKNKTFDKFEIFRWQTNTLFIRS